MGGLPGFPSQHQRNEDTNNNTDTNIATGESSVI